MILYLWAIFSMLNISLVKKLEEVMEDLRSEVDRAESTYDALSMHWIARDIENFLKEVKETPDETTTVIFRKWQSLNDGHETTIIDERVKTFPTKDEAVKSATTFIENTEADASWVRHTAYIVPRNADGEKTAEFAIGDDYYS